mgnify:FL=1
MKFLSADFILSPEGKLVPNAMVVLNPRAYVVDFLQPDSESLPDPQNVQHHKGVIIPGLVNAHCKLEISLIKRKIPVGTGMSGFIKSLVKERNATEKVRMEALEQGDREMEENGIVAVGDICNTSDTRAVKLRGKIRYRNFVEVFDLKPDRAAESFEAGLKISNAFSPLETSLVPHAPYTVSPALLQLLVKTWRENDVLSIHFMESLGERDWFLSNTGDLKESFLKMDLTPEWMGENQDAWFKNLNRAFGKRKSILVHGTYLDKVWLERIRLSEMILCTCPSANLYIENTLPDYREWINSGPEVCIGTDSLASNHALSVLREVGVIFKHFPDLNPGLVLNWATLNGARALGFDDELGSFERGKSPGVFLIPEWDGTTASFSGSVKPLSLI